MRKFSYILESKNDIVNNIEEIFIDFTDNGFSIKIDVFQGFYDIVLNIDKQLDWMDCIKNISVIDDKLARIGLKFINSNKISLTDKNGYLKFKYKLNNSKINKNINGFKQFKAYCENILGIYGLQGNSFKINVVSEEGFSNEEYFGWEIDLGYNVSEEDFLKEYPGYEDFLKKILNRKIDWGGAWYNVPNGVNNPMRFDKEGIETIEKLLQMANKFPDKLEIIKP